MQNLLVGEKLDIPCSLITANDMLTSLQANSPKSSSVTSKFLWCNGKSIVITCGHNNNNKAIQGYISNQCL